MENVIIGIDAGKWSTIAESKLGGCYFRTKVDESPDDLLGSETESSKVEINNCIYTIGAEAIQADYDTSKATLHHKLAVYTAIAKILNGKYKNVYLVVGCPASIYKNTKLRNEYRDFLLSNRAISIRVKGVNNQFFIKDIILAPETIGYPYQNIESSKNQLQGVIDIGGLNTNGCIYDGLSPIKDTMFTINLGSYILFNKIKNELSTQLNQNIQDYEIPYLIKDCPSVKGTAIIKSILNEHISRIKDETKKNNWNIKGLKLRFIGGGSLDLQDEINKAFDNPTISGSAVRANAQAFLKVGEIYYAQKLGKTN